MTVLRRDHDDGLLCHFRSTIDNGVFTGHRPWRTAVDNGDRSLLLLIVVIVLVAVAAAAAIVSLVVVVVVVVCAGYCVEKWKIRFRKHEMDKSKSQLVAKRPIGGQKGNWRPNDQMAAKQQLAWNKVRTYW